jgi:hypothetical protein
MMRVIRCFVLVACALGLASTASAAQGRKGNPAERRPPRAVAGELAPAEVIRHLDAYAVVQAQEALQLTDAQYGEFVNRLRRLQETRRRNQQSRNQIIQELRRLTGPQATVPADETVLRERLKALRDHDERATIESRKASDSLDEVITPHQQARFRIFEENIERRKLDLLMRARQAARRGGT